MLFINLKSFRPLILFYILLFIFYSIFYFRKIKLDDTAFFGGDTWEYQSMAVNWSKGYGLKFGGVLPFSEYKFTEVNSDVTPQGKQWYLTGCQKNNCSINFYRTPGYPILIGLIYKIFGVHPLIVKQFQLLLLIIIGSTLPLIGYYYWGNYGFLSGLISGFIFLNTYYQSLPNDILTESLITFSMFTVIIFYILLEKTKNPITALLFGIILGINLLIKSSNIFIPLMFLLYFIFQIIYKKFKIILFILYIIGILLIIIPWSSYATHKSGKFIILSTQGDLLLFESNNEFSIDGNWHPEGYSQNNNTYYQKPEIKKLSSFVKLISFYKDYYQIIPTMLFNKIKRGFEIYIFLKISLILLITETIRKYLIFNKNKKNAFIVISFITFLTLFILFEIVFKTKFNYPFKTVINIFTQTPYLIVLTILFFIFSYKKIGKSIPITFTILFTNYLLITLIFLGLPRYTQVIDFVFIFVSIKYLLSLFKFIYINFLPFKKHPSYEILC